MRARSTLRAAALALLAAAAAGEAAAVGAENFRASGRLDLTAKANRERVATNLDNSGYSSYNAAALRVNLDFLPSEKIAVMTEFFSPTVTRIDVYGAYVRFREIAGSGLSVEAGKIPPFFGGYSLRGYGRPRSLISYALMYQYHVAVAGNWVPKSPEMMLAVKENRFDPGAYGGGPAPIFLPPLYERCWDTGIELFGSMGAFDLAGGVTTGTLSNPQEEDLNSGKQFVGRVALQAAAGTRVGVSAAIGPYLESYRVYETPGSLPDTLSAHGLEVEDFDEISLGADIEWGYRHLDLFAEGLHKIWESPFLSEDLRSNSYHVEARAALRPGLYAAVSYGEILFSRITTSAGERSRWDFPIRRIEAGGGYFLDEAVLVRASIQWNELYGVEDDVREGPLPAVQLEVHF